MWTKELSTSTRATFLSFSRGVTSGVMPVPMVMETRAMLLGSVPRYLYKAKINTHQCNKFTGKSHRKRSLATWHRNERRRFPRWWSVWSQWLVCLCPAGAAQGYTAREPASTSTQTNSYTRSIYTSHEKNLQRMTERKALPSRPRLLLDSAWFPGCWFPLGTVKEHSEKITHKPPHHWMQ